MSTVYQAKSPSDFINDSLRMSRANLENVFYKVIDLSKIKTIKRALN